MLASCARLTTAIGFQLQERVTAIVCLCVIWADRWRGSGSEEKTTGSRATRRKHTRARAQTQPVAHIYEKTHKGAGVRCTHFSEIWYQRKKPSGAIHTVGNEWGGWYTLTPFFFPSFYSPNNSLWLEHMRGRRSVTNYPQTTFFINAVVPVSKS